MLTPGFTIVDCQTTPSGYYQIAFRSATTGHTVTATQTGRGGCVLFTPRDWEEELFKWLEENAGLAIEHMNELGFPELATAVALRESEWEDSVVITIVDLIEMGKVRVQG